MTLWFVFAMMTAAAIFAVLWPLGRGRALVTGGSDIEVYKDQLGEVRRDAAAGLIAAGDAEAARIEIARRLLAADAAQTPAQSVNRRARKAVAIVALAGLPLLALAIYLPLGAPRLPDQPLASRSAPASATQPLDQLVAQVEAHLDKNPSDGRGWGVLAPVLLKLNRYGEAARAFRNSITYAGETAERRADLGEALLGVGNGVVTSEAKAEFERALSLDPAAAKPRYFLGLAAEQDGRPAEAAKIWRGLLAQSPPDAPWRRGVQAALSRLQSQAPALPDGAMESVAGLNEGERTTMIRGMVERLATRLTSDGGGADEWLRLVRAYMVLGDRDKAREARGQARQALGGKVDDLRQFDEGVKPLGLDG